MDLSKSPKNDKNIELELYKHIYPGNNKVIYV